jgi:hypothetical protein
MKVLMLRVLFLLPVVLVSCASATTTVTVGSPESPLSPLAVREESPVATPSPPATTPAVELQVPTQDPQMASIEGSIAMEGYPAGGLPATLYLGDPTGANPMGAYVALDIETAIRGYVRSDGTFTFPNVPPGTYSVVVWTPAAAYIVPDPATGETWLIEISEDSRFDTGHIMVPAFTVGE